MAFGGTLESAPTAVASLADTTALAVADCRTLCCCGIPTAVDAGCFNQGDFLK